MNVAATERIKCVCGKNKWKIHQVDYENGAIECIECGATFPVIEGMIYLTPQIYKKTVQQFIEAHALPEEVIAKIIATAGLK
ncbi:MAG: hypothetical protein QXL15_02820 [Candidatus Korarchaeota archaeon]